MTDLTQAQQALKAQGEPIELGKVLPGDVVRLERTYPSGFTETFSGPVSYVADGHIVFSLGEGHTTARETGKCDRVVTITLLHRPPRRVEISKDDLILKTPIGTKVELVQNNGGIIHGTFQFVTRSAAGVDVYLGASPFDTAEVALDDIKAIYTEEVQS